MESAALIAIVEDDPDQRQNYASAIAAKGYRTEPYANRAQAYAGIKACAPDLVVVDIVLQQEVDGGFMLCRDLLTLQPELPVIFLTDRIDEIDRISGLRLGAWDYLPKPVSLNYLAERISSLLHLAAVRSQRLPHSLQSDSGLALDEEAMRACWAGCALDLTLTEFRLLAYLVRHPGHAISYERLMGETRQQYVTSNTINTHMRNLRKKIRKLDADFSCIANEYGYGYRWVEN